MKLRGFALAFLLVSSFGVQTVEAEPAPRGWELAMLDAAPVAVAADAIDIVGGELNGLTLVGAWELRGDHARFGGFSGLLIKDGRLIAISDQGWWLGASLQLQDGGLRVANASMAPMHDGEGDRYTKSGGDAEGLTLLGDRLAVSFERDHRLMMLRETGRMGATLQPRSFEQFRSNKGLEALASLPDGRMILFAEGTDADGIPMFVLASPTETDEIVTEARLPQPSAHPVTGADVGPDGRLYLVLREYSVLSGVSIRIMRYALGPDGFPEAETAETLAAFNAASGIDNMEGISLERRSDGRTSLWLISDDNYRWTQRTLLIQFGVMD
jgi:hypothetical protein